MSQDKSQSRSDDAFETWWNRTGRDEIGVMGYTAAKVAFTAAVSEQQQLPQQLLMSKEVAERVWEIVEDKGRMTAKDRDLLLGFAVLHASYFRLRQGAAKHGAELPRPAER